MIPLAATPNMMYLMADSIWLLRPALSRRIGTSR